MITLTTENAAVICNELFIKPFGHMSSEDIVNEILKHQKELAELYRKLNTGKRVDTSINKDSLQRLMDRWPGMFFGTEPIPGNAEMFVVDTGRLGVSFHITNQEAANRGRFYVTLPIYRFTLNSSGDFGDVYAKAFTSESPLESYVSELPTYIGITRRTRFGHPHNSGAHHHDLWGEKFTGICFGNNRFMDLFHRTSMTAGGLIEAIDRFMEWASNVHVQDCYGSSFFEEGIDPSPLIDSGKVQFYEKIPLVCKMIEDLLSAIVFVYSHCRTVGGRALVGELTSMVVGELQEIFPEMDLDSANEESGADDEENVSRRYADVVWRLCRPAMQFNGPPMTERVRDFLSVREYRPLSICHSLMILHAAIYAMWVLHRTDMSGSNIRSTAGSYLRMAAKSDIQYAAAFADHISRRLPDGTLYAVDHFGFKEMLRIWKYRTGVWDLRRYIDDSEVPSVQTFSTSRRRFHDKALEVARRFQSLPEYLEPYFSCVFETFNGYDLDNQLVNDFCNGELANMLSMSDSAVDSASEATTGSAAETRSEVA